MVGEPTVREAGRQQIQPVGEFLDIRQIDFPRWGQPAMVVFLESGTTARCRATLNFPATGKGACLAHGQYVFWAVFPRDER